MMTHKTVFSSLRTGASLVLVAVFAAGCGDPQQRAIKAIQELDFDFTVAEFHRAAEQGNQEGVEQFVDAGMNVNAQSETGVTALIAAAENGRAELIEWLLEKGADPNVTGPNGRTALVAAAQGGNADALRRLLNGGADPNRTDADNWSALTLAAYKGYSEAVDVLAPRSLDVLDDALLVSAFDGNPDVIDLLLTNGAYVNARSPNNQTALMIVAMNGHLDAVKVLLHNGANRYALDDNELTAANLAVAGGHLEVADYLNQPPDFDDANLLAAAFMGISGSDLVDEEFSGGGAFGIAPLDAGGPAGATATGTVTGMVEGGAWAPGVAPAGSGMGGIPDSALAAGVAAGVVEMPSDPVRRMPWKPARADGARLQSVTIEAPEEVAGRFQLRAYREEHLPVLLKEVSDSSAKVRLLSGGQESVEVHEGELIAGTGFEVVKFDRRYANSKHGKGALVDVSQMVVRDRRTGAKHLLVKDLPAKTSETYAVMRLDDSGVAYDVRPRDEFVAAGDDFAERYRVVDVRPTQVVIENVDTQTLHTISRVGSHTAIQ